MSEYRVHYPNFNVLEEEKHWDAHTREIVTRRLDTQSFIPYAFFTQQEADTLFELCSVLLDEEREEILAFVIHHFDSTLQSSLGEAQRNVGTPKQSTLIRDGLALVEQVCIDLYGGKFSTLDEDIQKQAVTELMQGGIFQKSGSNHIPVKDFTEKVFSEAVAAYYSHPMIWSEIGYAGPAYPRGYVRSELGLTDPWEAKRDGP